MKYIHYIDQLVNVQRQQHGDENVSWYIARQHPSYGLLFIEIRLRMAWAVLTNRADAVRFHEDDKWQMGMRCKSHPKCSHNTNGRDLAKPCSISASA